MIKPQQNDKPATIGFLLLQDFSMLAFTACVEPIQMANQLSGETLYQWQVIGVSKTPVKASNGILFTPECTVDDEIDVDAVFVCAGHRAQLQADPHVVNWLCQIATRGIVLGAVSSGAYLLAKAQTLGDVSCTAHWKYVHSIQKAFPALAIRPGLFKTNGKRYTSAGGTTGLDMFLNEIGSAHGASLALGVADQFNCGHIRVSTDRQRELQTRRITHLQPKLAKAIVLMEKSISAPQPIDVIARRLHLPTKKLNDLFSYYVNCSAKRYYLQLRLEHARKLLRDSSESVAFIAADCGFASASHFGRRYKARYGHSPRHERAVCNRPGSGQSACTPAGTDPQVDANRFALPRSAT